MAMKEHRGRPSSTPPEVRDKYVLNCDEVSYHFDRDKNANGFFKVDIKPYKTLPFKPLKQKPYTKDPVVMVFKTSNRSNAQTKIKVWANESIDYIITVDKLPGIPERAEILELGVGEGLIQIYSEKYNIN
jgi:hypothetical protein